MNTLQADHFFLDRKSQRHLREKLATIPRVAEDIAITETKQAVMCRPGLSKIRRPKKAGYSIPFHIGAAAAAHDLRSSLAAAVRHTCEYKGFDYWPVGYTHPYGFIGPLREGHRRLPQGYDEGAPMVTAKWLWKYMGSFAMTEGCEEFADAIVAAIKLCEKEIQGAVSEVMIDDARVKKANRQVLTAGQIEKIAPKLGDIGKGLNKRRVETLNYNQELWPCVSLIKGDPKFYRLGDVLEAHRRHVRKPRKKSA